MRERRVVMDSIARKLLESLQENARLSFAELGRRAGLSASAAAERIKRMEDAGIIRGYRTELDPASVGYPVQAIIRLALDGDHSKQLLAFLRASREVQECHHITGSEAFVLKVAMASLSELERLMESLRRFGAPATEVVLSSPVYARSLPCAEDTAAPRGAGL
jgi:Lrp/AsnC family transcriptional regulator, leucine-responsive regulatory protein